jgi:hypothetical protein
VILDPKMIQNHPSSMDERRRKIGENKKIRAG